MDPFIFGKRSKIHIIDVKQTLRGMLIARKLLMTVVSSGKDVVFVGTKRQARKPVRVAAEKCGMHYVSERWLGGMLTNFRTVRSRLQRLEELEGLNASGEIQRESKKAASRLKREMEKIQTNLGGVRKMAKLPGCVVVVDAKKEYIALREARKLGVPTVAILDTDSDPDTCDVAVPANDDSLKAIEIILNDMADAVSLGKTMVRPAASAGAAGRGRSRRRALASARDDEPQDEPVSAPEPVQDTAAAASTEAQTEVEPGASMDEAQAEASA
jgi:small subunit ribosomal protein S2